MKQYDNILKPRRDSLIVDSPEKLLQRNLITFDNTRQFGEEDDATVAYVIGSNEPAQVGSTPYVTAISNDENVPVLPIQLKVIPKSLELIYPVLDDANKNSLPLAYMLPGTSQVSITEGQKIRIRFIDGLRNEAIIIGAEPNNTALSGQQGGTQGNTSPRGAIASGGVGGGSGGSAGPVDGTRVSATNNTKIANDIALAAVAYFVSQGWTPEQACGLVGNLQAESGAQLHPHLTGDRHLPDTAHGIAQWRDTGKRRGDLRQTNFRTEYKGSNGLSIQDPKVTREMQLGYVQWELTNTESRAGTKLKEAKNPSEAAAMVDKYYERSSGAHLQKRKQNAETLYQAYINKNK